MDTRVVTRRSNCREANVSVDRKRAASRVAPRTFWGHSIHALASARSSAGGSATAEFLLPPKCQDQAATYRPRCAWPLRYCVIQVALRGDAR
jgi:hypothetical protein